MEDYADGVYDMTFGVQNAAGTGWVKVYDDEIGSWDIANGKKYEIQMGINRGTNTAFLSLYNVTDSVSVGSTSFVYSGFTESNSYYAMMKGQIKTTDATKSVTTGFNVDSITVIPELATITLLSISSLLLTLKRRK
jgi:cytochrome b